MRKTRGMGGGGRVVTNTNDVMFAYVHEEINILLSVLSIFGFYDFNLNTKGFVDIIC